MCFKWSDAWHAECMRPIFQGQFAFSGKCVSCEQIHWSTSFLSCFSQMKNYLPSSPYSLGWYTIQLVLGEKPYGPSNNILIANTEAQSTQPGGAMREWEEKICHKWIYAYGIRNEFSSITEKCHLPLEFSITNELNVCWLTRKTSGYNLSEVGNRTIQMHSTQAIKWLLLLLHTQNKHI